MKNTFVGDSEAITNQVQEKSKVTNVSMEDGFQNRTLDKTAVNKNVKQVSGVAIAEQLSIYHPNIKIEPVKVRKILN